MTQPIQVVWSVEVGRLIVDPTLVGQTLQLGTADGVAVELSFPPDIDLSLIGGASPQNAAGLATAAQDMTVLGVSYGRLTMVASLSTELDALTAVAPEHTPSAAEDEEVKRLRRSATVSAEMTLRRFIELLAIREKRLAITIERPPLQHLGRLSVGTPPVHIPWGHDPINVTLWGGGDGIPAQAVQEAATRTAAGDEAPLYWQLYREAFRRLMLTEDDRPSVVEAATAVEVGIKTGLRLRDPSAIVELLTDTNRIQDLLLKKAASIIFGQSFATADQANYQLVDALLNQRHALVHRGQAPDVAALKQQLPAIRSLLEWIDQNIP